MRRGSTFALVLSMASLVGCADNPTGRQELMGTVTYQGQPLPLATVQFRPEDGSRRMTVMATVENGRFRVPSAHGLTPGRYRILISSTNEAAPEGSAGRERLPVKYNSQSELVVEVVAGKPNNFDFSLE